MAPRTRMVVCAERLASFYGRRRGGAARRWPHEQPCPEALARAGFYYAPSRDEDDNVVCFCCGKQLGGWTAADDPLEEHYAHAPTCGWVLAVTAAADGERFGADDVRWAAAGATMVAARVRTFGRHWPHEHKKGWRGKVLEMARAGFYYAPTGESDDMVVCAYCGLGLDGWEPADDPLFFTGFAATLPDGGASPAPVAARSKRRSSRLSLVSSASADAPRRRPVRRCSSAARAQHSSRTSSRASSRRSSFETAAEQSAAPACAALDEVASPVSAAGAAPAANDDTSGADATDSRTTRSPTDRRQTDLGVSSATSWDSVDRPPSRDDGGDALGFVFEAFLKQLLAQSSPDATRPELSEVEKDMTVEEWLKYITTREANQLHNYCECIIQRLSAEGARAKVHLQRASVR